MERNNNGKRISVTDAALVLIPLVMIIGAFTWMSTCGPKDDGSFMACHWAGQMVKALGCLQLVLAIVHAASADVRFKTGIDVSLACTGALTILTPGMLINLCQDSMMMCRAGTQPWTIVLSVLIIVAALADIFFTSAGADAKRHHRGQDK